MSRLLTIHDLVNEMCNYGLHIDTASLDTSGKLKRCGTSAKPRSKNGWYVVHINGDFTNAVFGDYQQNGTPITWCNRDKNSYSSSDRAQLYTRSLALRKEREEERIILLGKLRSDYTKYVRPLSGSHSYLNKKDIASCLQMSTTDSLGTTYWGALVIPMRSIEGELMGYQTISPNSSTKMFATGSQKKGNFYTIAPETVTLANCDRVFIAEGLATGISVYLAINDLLDGCNYCVLVAFDVGNISSVVDAVWSQHPDKHITLIADNDDTGTGKNVGIDACNLIVAKHLGRNIKVFAPGAINKEI